jgi:hypothetical protein
MTQATRPFITVDAPPPTPRPRYVVVEVDGDVIVAPQGAGKYEDSSCVDEPCAPVVFDDLALAEEVAEAMWVDRAGFCSFWRAKELPAGCTAEGLAILALPEFAREAARLRDIFGQDALTAVGA